MDMVGRSAFALAIVLAGASGARALPPLSENDHVVGSLLAAAIGDRVRRECPSISPRILRVLSAAQALKAYARRQGYSEAQIEAFIDSDADKKRIEAHAERWLREAGAVKGDPQSYCAVGLKEIERESLTGSLLRAH